MRMPLLSVLSISAVLIASSPSFADLKIGDKAPPVKVAKWLKGTPVNSFEPGKVYVVEFWATWCGPCRASMPHLSDIADKYRGKATICSIDIRENALPQPVGGYMKRVSSFVERRDQVMRYNVAADGDRGMMDKLWLKPYHQMGIPTAFVIDKQCRVAWIGHPLIGLEEAVSQAIDGTIDYKKSIASQKHGATVDEIELKTYKLVAAKKYTQALHLIDSSIAKDPSLASDLIPDRFNPLLHVDEQAAYQYARSLPAVKNAINASMRNIIAYSILENAPRLKSPDYALALDLAKKAVEFDPKSDPDNWDILARAYFRTGNTAEAIKAEERGIALATADADVDDYSLKIMRKNMAIFKKAHQ